jgi:hypothetical protein
MLEYLAPSFIYTLIKDLLSFVRGRRRKLTPSEILQLREKWRPQFENELWTNYKEGLRRDVIVRDVRRLDSYPNIDDTKKGISPWFRCALVDTYHKGALLWLSWGTLTRTEDEEWRFTNYNANEAGDIKVALIGKVPFELVEAVNWKGDEYYYFPHIYCYFDASKQQPYEELVFCEERERPNMPPYYSEIAKYDDVRRRSLPLGIKYFS